MATRKEIYDAVDNVKEYLALNKWNDAMMLMAQISIEVIENLTDEALIVSKGYEEDLKTLFAGGIINDATSHNLETLIVSGVQANNGVDIPSDYVKKALTVLEDELKVVFNDDAKFGVTESEKEIAEANAEKKDDPSFVYDESDVEVKEGYEDEGDEPAFINKDGDVDFRTKERLRKKSLINALSFDKRKISKLIAIIIPIVLIIILAMLIKSCVSGRNVDVEELDVLETYETTFEEPTYEIIETTTTTPPPTTTEAGIYNVTGDRVWIRDQATTTSRRIAGVDKGDQVRVIRFYDNDWAIVNYDGKEAFISRLYIVKVGDDVQVEPEVTNIP